MTGRVLLVGADAERRSPTISLLRFVGWLAEHHPELDAEVLLLAGGTLEQEFHARMPTTVVAPPPAAPRRGVGIEDRVLQARPGLAPWWRARQADGVAARQLRGLDRHRLVYVADARAIGVLRLLPPQERVVLAHVHHRDADLRRILTVADRRMLVERSHHLLAGSDAVRADLLRVHGLGEGSVTTHDLMVEPSPLPDGDVATRAARRAESGLAGDAVIVGAGGQGGWRDGFDLFARTAWELRRAGVGPPVGFLWAAAGQGPAPVVPWASGTAPDVGMTVVDDGSPPLSWLTLLDVFVETTRVDDVPAGALDAAMAEVPVVCFGGGATADLARRGVGLVAAYPSPFLLAGAVRTLLPHEGRRRAMGTRGAEWVRAHHDTAVRAPALWEEIDRWCR